MFEIEIKRIVAIVGQKDIFVSGTNINHLIKVLDPNAKKSNVDPATGEKFSHNEGLIFVEKPVQYTNDVDKIPIGTYTILQRY
jgi:hypothetical protein